MPLRARKGTESYNVQPLIFKDKHMKELIEKFLAVERLDKDYYSIAAFSDTTYYHSFDTETEVVSYSRNTGRYYPDETLEFGEIDFKDLSDLDKCEIILEMYDKYCGKNE